MWTKGLTPWRVALCLLVTTSALALCARGEDEVPSESQCRPYIEKALKELESGDTEDSGEKNDSNEVGGGEGDTREVESSEDATVEEDAPSVEVAEEAYGAHDASDDDSHEQAEDNDTNEADDSGEKEGDSNEATNEDTAETESAENNEDSGEDSDDKQDADKDSKDDDDSNEAEQDSKEIESETQEDDADDGSNDGDDSKQDEENAESDGEDTQENTDEEGDSQEAADEDSKDDNDTKEDTDESQEDDASPADADTQEDKDSQEDDTVEDTKEDSEDEKSAEDSTADGDGDDSEKSEEEQVTAESADESEEDSQASEDKEDSEGASEEDEPSDEEGTPEEDLLLVGEIPENLRSRKHIAQILRLDEDASEAEQTVDRSAEIILRDLKKLYENNIKPLETLYKYRDLSNRHFGDSEIFSKPLVLFMGPWSGGKSSILNYLTGLEFTKWSLRTGAEPSPAYFNILMHGDEPQVLDGTQLAADFTFSGLQKFGQGLEERLRGLKYPSKLLEKVNIVEIPGILEVRKQVSRVFPFNDACQWFIDRADVILLVYDPSKLDVGPETEAILDQLKGRESQTRIVLNKADSVKPEELMRVQSALIWNISPLMSSAQPPAMYTVSLWSMPWQDAAPVRLLQAQERALLQDLRTAIDRRIENKISSARRFAVRVRNHAKMVDCYLTTYYNHKTIFGNKKLIADAIIENPQNYHIYEGLSTLTNISRYDLPDPETYRDFFRLNPVYEFQPLSATCTYFRGCPLTKLDVCIAYDLPELVGKYKKMVETATPQGMPKS